MGRMVVHKPSGQTSDQLSSHASAPLGGGDKQVLELALSVEASGEMARDVAYDERVDQGHVTRTWGEGLLWMVTACEIGGHTVIGLASSGIAEPAPGHRGYVGAGCLSIRDLSVGQGNTPPVRANGVSHKLRGAEAAIKTDFPPGTAQSLQHQHVERASPSRQTSSAGGIGPRSGMAEPRARLRRELDACRYLVLS
jgi:hypothetical protein